MLAVGRWSFLRKLIGFGFALAFLPSVAAAQQPDTTGLAAKDSVSEVRVRKTIVVTGSRTRQTIQEAPVAMSVIRAAEIAHAPANDIGDLIRNLPGVNVVQFSARDIEIVGRGSAGTLSNSELALVDGRTLNLDFLGFVMWDFLPVDMREIRQIEVLRGPASAVWGANALAGVINVITKRPQEMLGTTLLAGGGERQIEYGSVTHAGLSGAVSYKLSASYFTQDAYDRPRGLVPGTATPYPDFPNRGTSQPKFDARVDYDRGDRSRWSLATGYAGTDGILHSGIGPFDLDRGTFLSYVRGEYERRALRVGFFANMLDGDATNLLTRGVDGLPIAFGFATQTYNIDFSHTAPIGERNALTYGANLRRSVFDIFLAPRGRDRNEAGAFAQNELLLGTKLRWVAGLRWDNIDPIGSVFSPRTSVLFSAGRNHTMRVAFNRAFRTPTVINNHLETSIVNEVSLPPDGRAYRFPSHAHGNLDLMEGGVDAIEAGYVGTFAERWEVDLSLYYSEFKDGIDFYPASYYSASNPPPDWPYPPGAVPPNTFPEVFTFRNHGNVGYPGVEFSVRYAPTDSWSTFANYSYLDTPRLKGVQWEQINHPPRNRINLGLAWSGSRLFASGNLNFVDDGYWADVLDSRYWGITKAFTQVNGSVGTKMFGDRVELSVRANNLFDTRAQEHVFGDVLSRTISGEVRFRY